MPYPEKLSVHTIWDEIACYIDSTKDLLSLALTCQAFKELVIPDHLEYRYICCDLRRLDVWRFLESRPRLAKGVQTLELVYEPDANIRVPHIFDNIPNMLHYNVPVTVENMMLFRNSLSHMIFLKSFRWIQGYAPIQEISDIFHVLTDKAPLLAAFSVGFYWLGSQMDDQLQLDDNSIWTLRNLTKVAIDHPGRAAIQMILSFCPDIEDLSLSEVSSTSTFYLMKHANLTRLRRLHLWSDDSSSIPANPDIHEDLTMIIAPFLDRHTNLESLHLTLTLFDVITPNQQSSCLPKLWSIGSDHNSSILTSFLSDNVLSRLVHWQCPIGTINVDTLPLMDKLETLYLPGYVLLESVGPFLTKAPNLKKITLSTTDPEEIWDVNVAQEELIKNIFQCARLTHVFCDFIIKAGANRTPLYDQLRHLCETLSTLQALEYFEVTLDNKRVYVKLLRDEDGLYSGYGFVTLEEVGYPDKWGNLFLNWSD
ncbi:hypothetical protein Clacol_007061 [Clathrus columnatus]|uniref:F-box domain-containing protein n=1 Tax=Clathrus columnatus TaxID=1419009 RepID=A0AAV5AK33_9AGAM|nr:hypothetical protein Clacol_007061 [Clathrus columnatus]